MEQGAKETCWGTTVVVNPDGSKLERRCHRWPLKGQKVCSRHGGGTRKAKAVAEVRVANEELKKTLLRFGQPVEEDPKEVLLHAIAVAHGHTLLLEQMLAEIQPEDVGSDDPQTRARSRGLLNLHSEWQDRAATLSAQAIRVGIEERLVRTQEWQVGAFLKVIQDSTHVLAPGDKEAFLKEVSGRLRLLAEVSG